MGIYQQRFDTSVGVSHLYARHPSLFKFLVFCLLPYWILFAKIFQDSLSSACLEIYCSKIFFFFLFFLDFTISYIILSANYGMLILTIGF